MNVKKPHMNLSTIYNNNKTLSFKVLIYMTTHLSIQHLDFLRYCWPLVVERSQLLQQSNITVFVATNESSLKKEAENLLLRAYYPIVPCLNMIQQDNPGYHSGAMLAMHKAMEDDLFRGYDWVIRLNPDVLILDDKWIMKTMMDSSIDAILVICKSGIHTDFTVFRPSKVFQKGKSFTSNFMLNAENETKYELSETLKNGRYKILPGNFGKIRGYCRVRGKTSPVIHDHEFVQECIPPIIAREV